MKHLGLIVAAAATAIALAVAPPADAAPAGPPAKAQATYHALNLFGEVFQQVRADYVDKVSNEKLIESAINGMLTSLDPHSNYLSPKSFTNMKVQTRGEFGGLGIEVSMEKGLIKVVSPIDDTPASRAGIKPGDLIVGIDGKPVQGMTLPQAVEKMRGRIGSKIDLSIRRGSQAPFKVTLTRATITIQSVRSHLEAHDVGYIRITAFTEQTDVGLDKAMKKLKKEAKGHLTGVVLDLRNNPGGLLDQAVAVANTFLNRGEIVSTRGRHPQDAQRYDARPGDLADGAPMVVMINGGSASASEIVAGALQDHHRAVLLGTRSFGKGSVQTIIPLPGHGAMRLTTARYYTPSGRSIQALGIEPNIVVPAARIENPTTSGATKTVAKNGAGAGAIAPGIMGTREDYQLARAIDVVRGIALFDRRLVN